MCAAVSRLSLQDVLVWPLSSKIWRVMRQHQWAAGLDSSCRYAAFFAEQRGALLFLVAGVDELFPLPGHTICALTSDAARCRAAASSKPVRQTAQASPWPLVVTRGACKCTP